MESRTVRSRFSEKRAELATEVELLGREAVGTREVVAAAPAFTLVDFLGEFLKKGLNPQAALGLAATATSVGTLTQLAATSTPAITAPGALPGIVAESSNAS